MKAITAMAPTIGPRYVHSAARRTREFTTLSGGFSGSLLYWWRCSSAMPPLLREAGARAVPCEPTRTRQAFQMTDSSGAAGLELDLDCVQHLPRQLLARGPVVAPRIDAQPRKAAGNGAHGERRRIEGGPQLGPGQWNADGCAWAGAGGIRRNRGIGPIVSQVIDEDLLRAASLGERCRVRIGICAFDSLGYRTRECKARRPVRMWYERHDDVQARAAGGLDKALEPQCAQRVADDARAADDASPRHLLARIEVEHESVGMLDVVDDAVPGVDFEDAHLHETDDSGNIGGDEIFPELLLLLNAYSLERRGRPHLGVLHVEALRAQPFGAANERQRPALHVGHDPVADALVIAREVELREAELRVDHAVRVRDADAAHDVVVGRRLLRDRGRRGGGRGPLSRH